MKKVSIALLISLGLTACTSNNKIPTPPNSVSSGMGSSPSFASSTLCADNPYLQKYQCSFIRVEQAARAGDPDAQYALGYLYFYGIGTTQDRQTGLMWIRKSAAQGQTVAVQALKTLSGPSSGVKQSGPSHLSATVSTSTPPATSDNNVNSKITAPTSSAKPLSDYLPNYGEKRIDSTEPPPPNVNLSSPPAEVPNQ